MSVDGDNIGCYVEVWFVGVVWTENTITSGDESWDTHRSHSSLVPPNPRPKLDGSGETYILWTHKD